MLHPPLQEGITTMNIELVLALLGFASLTLIVPGPNNLLLMMSGATFGLRRTLPHIFGAVLGFSLLMGTSALGLSQVLLTFPWLGAALKYGGASWLAWFGWKFIKEAINDQAGIATQTRASSRPFRASEAAIFQWANPSALVLAVSTVSAFASVAETASGRAMIICTVFASVATFATLIWAGAGASLSAAFAAPRAGRVLRGAMGALIILTAFLITQT